MNQPTDNKLEDILQIELKDAGTQVFKLIDVNKALTALRKREARLLATLQTAVLAAAPEKGEGHNKDELCCDSCDAIDQYTTAIKQLFESEEPLQ